MTAKLKVYTILRQYLKPLFGIWQSHVWLIEGKSKYNNQQLTIFHIGSEVQKNYIASLIFKADFQQQFLGKKNIFQIKYLQRRNHKNVSMCIIEGKKSELKYLRAVDDFYLPQWISSTVLIPLTANNQSAKSDFRKIKRHNLSYSLSSEPKDFDNFYHHMYLPYVTQRFKGQEIPMTYEQFITARKQKTVELLFVEFDGKKVAGQIIDYSSVLPRLWSIGVLVSDKKYLKMSCTAACYYFSSLHLTKQGYSTMNLGKSRPMINDGPLQFKIKWGMEVTNYVEKGFLIKPLSNDKLIIDIFSANPFIYTDNNKLHSAVFVKNIPLLTEKELDKMIKRNLTMLPGLTSMALFSDIKRKKPIRIFTSDSSI
jgi:hypothetical protein